MSMPPCPLRRAALLAGEKTYTANYSCKHGHPPKRLTRGGCYECEILWKRESGKRWYAKNKEHKLGKNRQWDLENKERAAKTSAEWFKRNPDKLRAAMKKHRIKRNSDPKYLPYRLVTQTLKFTLKRARLRKTDRTHKMLGYTGAELVAHLESHMEPWMTWVNYGKRWNIDHTIPIAEYIRQGETDVRVINALTNLRPMCRFKNCEKKDYFPDWLRVPTSPQPVASSAPSPPSL